MAQVNRLDPLLGFWESLSESDKKQLSLIYETSTRLGIKLGLTLRSLANLDQAHKSSKCLNEAANEYLAFKHTQNLRPSSLDLIKTSLSQMVIRFPKYQCDQITTKMLEHWFSDKKWKRSTVDGVIAKIGPFFSWAVREGWRLKNPVKGILRPKKDDSPPSIFTPNEVQRLFKLARKTDPGMIPYLALGLFAGVRPMEIERLSWNNILNGFIEITADKAKTRQRRLISISDNLQQWLNLGGELPVSNKRKRIARLISYIGLNWKPDIMRHSFASYHLALHMSPDKTAFELGHRDTKMLFRHYRELVSTEDAQKYWNIRP